MSDHVFSSINLTLLLFLYTACVPTAFYASSCLSLRLFQSSPRIYHFTFLLTAPCHPKCTRFIIFCCHFNINGMCMHRICWMLKIKMLSDLWKHIISYTLHKLLLLNVLCFRTIKAKMKSTFYPFHYLFHLLRFIFYLLGLDFVALWTTPGYFTPFVNIQQFPVESLLLTPDSFSKLYLVLSQSSHFLSHSVLLSILLIHHLTSSSFAFATHFHHITPHSPPHDTSTIAFHSRKIKLSTIINEQHCRTWLTYFHRSLAPRYRECVLCHSSKRI